MSDDLVSLAHDLLLLDRPPTLCKSCLTPFPRPHTRTTTTCTHPVSICNPCITTYILTILPTTPIPCPECPHPLSHTDIARFSTPYTLHTYDSLLLQHTLSHMPDFTWCVHPGCHFGQQHDNGALYPIVTCQRCRNQMCFVHGVRWHSGQTCAEYEASRDADQYERATQAYLVKSAKRCPGRGCGVKIEKSGGCHVMVCARCGHTFDWRACPSWAPAEEG